MSNQYNKLLSPLTLLGSRTLRYQTTFLAILSGLMVLLLTIYRAVHKNIIHWEFDKNITTETIGTDAQSSFKMWNVQLNFNYPSKNISQTSAHRHFHRLVQTVDTECRHHARLGGVYDGGWDVCLTPPFTLKPPCLVYDFGIGRRWDFADAVSEEFGCTVRAFDPTIGMAEHNRSDLIHFYPVGLWGSDGDHVGFHGDKTFPASTLKTLLKRFSESQSVVDFLKVDVENSEWSALGVALGDGSLELVKQLALEVHSHRNKTTATVLRDMGVLRGLHDLGFLKWKDDWNRYTLTHVDGVGYVSMCHELYFINSAFLRV